MQKALNYQQNSTVYPQQLPLDFSVITSDIYRTGSLVHLVCEGVEEANLLKYINFANRDAHGYIAASMLRAVLLAFAMKGYTSYRDLKDYCKHDKCSKVW